MSDPAPDEHAEAAVAAGLLVHGARVHRLSVAFTTTAVVALSAMALVQPNRLAMVLATLAVVAGVAELWFALRVAFDARAFQRLARGNTADGVTVAAFDAAMGTLGLMPADKTGRPVATRVRGAMRLLGRQVALLVLQVVLLVAVGWVLAVAKG